MKTRKDRVIWESKQEEQLVDFIKEREHVWNNKSDNFSNLRLRKKTFSEFAAKLGPEYTVKTVRERWTNIRNTFMHNLRRVEKTQGTAQYPEDVYEPSWHLWDRCQFMLGVRDYKRKDESSDECQFNNVKIEGKDALYIDDLLESTGKTNQVNDENPVTIASLRSLPSASAASLLARRHRHKTNDKSSCEQVLAEAISVLKSMQTEMDEIESGSKFTYISRHVADRLGKMRPFDAECASRKIMEVLALYNEFNPSNPNRT